MSDAVFEKMRLSDFEKSVHSMSRKEMKSFLKVILKNLFSLRRNRIRDALSMPSPAVDSLAGIAGTNVFSDEEIKNMRLDSK